MIRGLLSMYQNESARRFSKKVTGNSTSPAVTWPILSDYLAESFEKNSLVLGVGRNLEWTSPSCVESWADFARVVFAGIYPILQTFERRACISRVDVASRKKCSIDRIQERTQKSFYRCAFILIFVYRRIVNYAINDGWPLSDHRAAFPKWDYAFVVFT